MYELLLLLLGGIYMALFKEHSALQKQKEQKWSNKRKIQNKIIWTNGFSEDVWK